MSESTLAYCQVVDRRYEADTNSESECPFCRALAAEKRVAELEARDQRFSLREPAALRATVADQARRLEEAYAVMNVTLAGGGTRQMRAWLAANAPRAEHRHDADECPCVIAEKPINPCSSGCWHFTPDAGHLCANCGQAEPEQPETIVPNTAA